MKFTKEEISLCKQIAEKERKDLYEGDWVNIRENYLRVLHQPSVCQFGSLYDVPCPGESQSMIADKGKWFSLWTISDCLEFFDEREMEIAINHFDEGGWRVQLWKKHFQAFYSDYSCEDRTENKTGLEACLKAVLAVLEEEK